MTIPRAAIVARGAAGVCLLLALHALAGWSDAAVVRDLTKQKTVRAVFGDAPIDDAGTTLYANSTVNLASGDPLTLFQVVEWDRDTGDATQVGDLDRGTRSTSAVSDDGLWLAFLSSSDPLGQNPDLGVEVFAMQSDGTALSQVTATSGGYIHRLAFAGSANRIVFVGDVDPLGTNPGGVEQIFAIDRDGTGLTQVTSVPAGTTIGEFSVSDDGTRIAFGHDGNPFGTNPDGGEEIFAVNADGSNLRQLTVGADGDSYDPFLAGGGSRIAFTSLATLTDPNPTGFPQVFVVDWDGTGLRRVTGLTRSGEQPSIKDDGNVVYYINYASGNVYRQNADGSGVTQLTTNGDLNSDIYNAHPVVSGSGGDVVFLTHGPFSEELNPDGGDALMVMDSSGGDVRLLLEFEEYHTYEVDITPDGSRVVYGSDATAFGSNPGARIQVFRVDPDGSGPVQVTSLTDGDAYHPSVSADGGTIVFHSHADPVGQNPDHRQHVFAVNADGTNLRQLTVDARGGGISYHPVIAADGSWVVFQSVDDHTGENPDSSAELFAVRPDGTGMVQLTSDDDGLYKRPRVSADGSWVAFMSGTNVLGGNDDLGQEIFRIRTDGTGFERLTGDPDYSSHDPDISGSGDRIVFDSGADFLGTNPENNVEIFMIETATDALTQLTFTAAGGSLWPRISKDGAYVVYQSYAPFFGETVETEPYRVEVATGRVERAGGLRQGTTALGSCSWKWCGWIMAIDEDGNRAAITSPGDRNGENPDDSSEVWLMDWATEPSISVGRDSPTVVTWTAEPQPVRYDVIRGDVADLRIVGDEVDLGDVVCLEDDSADNTTAGSADPEDPDPGQAFFFVYRGSQGPTDGPGSYGQGTGDKERVAGSGDCQP